MLWIWRNPEMSRWVVEPIPWAEESIKELLHRHGAQTFIEFSHLLDRDSRLARESTQFFFSLFFAAISLQLFFHGAFSQQRR